VALISKGTIPAERPQLVAEVSANPPAGARTPNTHPPPPPRVCQRQTSCVFRYSTVERPKSWRTLLPLDIITAVIDEERMSSVCEWPASLCVAEGLVPLVVPNSVLGSSWFSKLVDWLTHFMVHSYLDFCSFICAVYVGSHGVVASVKGTCSQWLRMPSSWVSRGHTASSSPWIHMRHKYHGIRFVMYCLMMAPWAETCCDIVWQMNSVMHSEMWVSGFVYCCVWQEKQNSYSIFLSVPHFSCLVRVGTPLYWKVRVFRCQIHVLVFVRIYSAPVKQVMFPEHFWTFFFSRLATAQW
jgi:hypothetical protein